jgi:phosphatidylglycerol:prolipoprotein diacylglycerol transferase
MAFPAAAGCRHPLQVYQFLMEGVLLLATVWMVHRISHYRRVGLLSGTFLVGYGAFRSIAELFREAGEAGFLGLTTGHYLSIPMVLIGTWLIIRSLCAENRTGEKPLQSDHPET